MSHNKNVDAIMPHPVAEKRARHMLEFAFANSHIIPKLHFLSISFLSQNLKTTNFNFCKIVGTLLFKNVDTLIKSQNLIFGQKMEF